MYITKIMLRTIPALDKTVREIRVPFSATAVLNKAKYIINGIYIIDPYDHYIDLHLPRLITDQLDADNQAELFEEIQDTMLEAPVLKKLKEKFHLFWSNL